MRLLDRKERLAMSAIGGGIAQPTTNWSTVRAAPYFHPRLIASIETKVAAIARCRAEARHSAIGQTWASRMGKRTDRSWGSENRG